MNQHLICFIMMQKLWRDIWTFPMLFKAKYLNSQSFNIPKWKINKLGISSQIILQGNKVCVVQPLTTSSLSKKEKTGIECFSYDWLRLPQVYACH